MGQTNLFDWLEKKRVILQSPPAQPIQERTFIIEQLKPIFAELETLEFDNFSICEALTHYTNHYQEKGQQAILKPSE